MTSPEALEAIKPPLWAFGVFAVPFLFDGLERIYDRMTENGGETDR